MQKDLNQLKDITLNPKDNDYITKFLTTTPDTVSTDPPQQENNITYNTDPAQIDIAKKLISIYNSPSTKKSLSINIELEKYIKKFISEAYGITDNDSKIFNTALLIALLRNLR